MRLREFRFSTFLGNTISQQASCSTESYYPLPSVMIPEPPGQELCCRCISWDHRLQVPVLNINIDACSCRDLCRRYSVRKLFLVGRVEEGKFGKWFCFLPLVGIKYVLFDSGICQRTMLLSYTEFAFS